MTETDVMRPKAGRVRSAPVSPLGVFDSQVREDFLVPKKVGKKIIGVLRGPHRAMFLEAVNTALARPREDDLGGAAPMSSERAAEHARTLERLGKVRPETAERIINALRLHPRAIIGAVLPRHHPLPRLPKGLRWPQDFNKAPEFGRHPKAPGGVVAYLKREWADIIAARKIDMPTLRENFPHATAGIETYTKPHHKTGERRTLPKKLTIPILPQVNDRLVARVLAGKEVVAPKDVPRLYAALRRRALAANNS